jgi:hypothetical protein
MRENMSKTEHVTSPERFYELLFSGRYNVIGWDEFSDEVIQVQYRNSDGFVEPNANTSVVLAA